MCVCVSVRVCNVSSYVFHSVNYENSWSRFNRKSTYERTIVVRFVLFHGIAQNNMRVSSSIGHLVDFPVFVLDLWPFIAFRLINCVLGCCSAYVLSHLRFINKTKRCVPER